MEDFHVAKIGRLIIIALPKYNWVTIIIPFPFNGTKQISGSFDYIIDLIENKSRLK